MSRSSKFLVIVLCLSACACGALISVGEVAKDDRAKTNVVPVNNLKPDRASQIWA
jgi:hypothetical protein